MNIFAVILIVAFIILAILSLTLLRAYFSLAPWVPTKKKDMERINSLADLKSGQIFYEIGCGTANVSMYIARKNPEVEVVGIELAMPIYIFAKIRNFLFGPKNLSIKFGDAFNQDYRNIDVVYLYGLPQTANGKLKEKLEGELKSGAKFISYAFAVKGWKGEKWFQDKPTSSDVSVNICIK